MARGKFRGNAQRELGDIPQSALNLQIFLIYNTKLETVLFGKYNFNFENILTIIQNILKLMRLGDVIRDEDSLFIISNLEVLWARLRF